MQGTLTWPLKNVSKHQLPITVMSAVALASTPRSQSPPNLGDLGTVFPPAGDRLKNAGWSCSSDVGYGMR